MKPGDAFCIDRELMEVSGVNLDFIKSIPKPSFNHLAVVDLNTENVLIMRFNEGEDPFDLLMPDTAGHAIQNATRKL